MLEIVRGQTTAPLAAKQLAEELERIGPSGTFFVGYPVLATSDDSITIEGLLVSAEHGLVAFVIDDEPVMPHSTADWARLRDEQDAIFYALSNNLSRTPALRKGRRLAIEPQVVTIVPETVAAPLEAEVQVASLATLEDTLTALRNPPTADLLEALNAALQRVSNIKPRKKRQSVTRPDSRGAVLKALEAKIANLDRWQKPAAIESPDGPQRIRGLAGSGKTIVLALKAAYLHSQHPDWHIAITFYSRSLRQQFRDLVRRFCFEHRGDEPDWDRVHILHSWGGVGRPGFYNTVAEQAGVLARDYAYARMTYGMRDAFAGICKELYAAISINPPTPIFDAVLIDEAQDLPTYFFRLVYAFTKEPRRIVWAYDELQNLSEAAMPSTADLFGTDAEGQQLVTVENRPGEPKRDISLPRCYRNTPWALSLAHALGFGIYREGGLIQHFDEASVWDEIGYRVADGHLALGKRVTLERHPDSYPAYFLDLLKRDDVVVLKTFDDRHSQSEWIARAIKANLQKDELEHDDILVVFTDPLTAKKRASSLMQVLARHGIDSHLVGETASADEIFQPDSVALAHIYRAKGNEAPMVYVVDSQHCASGPELIRLRNTLFTAITRSRAWIRICGYGAEMRVLQEEIAKIQQNDYHLKFKIPTAEQLKRMRTVHRDLSPGERRKAQKAEKGLKEFLAAVKDGTIQPEALDPSIVSELERLIGENGDDHGD